VQGYFKAGDDSVKKKEVMPRLCTTTRKSL